MVSLISFDISSPQSVDSASETQVEILLEEKELKTSVDFIVNILTSDFRDTDAFAGFSLVIPRSNLLYLNTIFKPPIFLLS